MTPSVAIDIFRQALLTTFWLSLPLLAIGLIVGVVVGVLQIVTSLQDPTFSTVPRLAAFFASLLILLPWMTMKLISYTILTFGDFTRYAK